MLKRILTKSLSTFTKRSFASLTKEDFEFEGARIQYIGGSSNFVDHSHDVELRGIKLKGNSSDLPALIFFPDLFDQAENWISYFMNSRKSILDYRDVYIIYPRNFGSSDWCDDTQAEPGEELANDIERFMYTHQLTTATLGGHGFGARNAMLAACYKSHLLTGVLAYDYAPQDYTYFRVANTYKNILQNLNKMGDLSLSTVEEFSDQIKSFAQEPKLRALLEQNFKVNKDVRQLDFNLPYILDRFNDLIDWKWQYGIYGGRTRFIFPEYSHFVFLNSNTLSMMKVCVHNDGFLNDIFTLGCDDNDNTEQNHWIYENESLSEECSFLSCDFLQKKDGVHVLLHNRLEMVERTPVPTLRLERADQYGGGHTPSHFHHNWRFHADPKLK